MNLVACGFFGVFLQGVECPLPRFASLLEALCFEIGGIIGAALTNETYYSSMPISIDGVNNGTQHLAAMSLDEKAGKLVGLTPMKIPKDFYLVMGKEILNINKDTEIGNKLKEIPMKLVRKGISKRGSMTRAYDAGARKIGEIIFQDGTPLVKINKSSGCFSNSTNHS